MTVSVNKHLVYFAATLRLAAIVLLGIHFAVHAQPASESTPAERADKADLFITTNASSEVSETDIHANTSQTEPDASSENTANQLHTDTESPISTSNASSEKTQWDIEKESIGGAVSTGLTVVILISVLAIPFAPFWVLEHLSKTPGEVAFANSTEIVAYLLGLVGLAVGIYGFQSTPSLILKSISAGGIGLSSLVLLSLFGYQRQLSSNFISAVLMYMIKVAYFCFTLIFSFLLYFLALFLLKRSYEEAKQRDYVRSGLMLGGAAASWNSSNRLIDQLFKFANGEQNPEIAIAFPGDSLYQLIKQGFQGYSSRYTCQKRWKPAR